MSRTVVESIHLAAWSRLPTGLVNRVLAEAGNITISAGAVPRTPSHRWPTGDVESDVWTSS